MLNLIKCMSLDNLSVDSVNGIYAAYGNIYINRYAESRKLFITSISLDKPATEQWTTENCNGK
jgi:hypothetical protein